MADHSKKALSEFVSEAQEVIEALAKGLMRLEGAGADPDPVLLNSVFRAAHSLKGLSAMFDVERLSRLAHALEDALDDLRMGRRPLDATVIDLLLEAPEVFSSIISEESSGAPHASSAAAARLTDQLRAAEREAAPRGTTRCGPWRWRPRPAGSSPSTRSTAWPRPCAGGWGSTGCGSPSSWPASTSSWRR